METKRSAVKLRALLGAGAVAAVAVALSVWALLRSPAPRSELHPDQSAVRYRHAGSSAPADGPDSAAAIRALEARLQTPGGSAIDMAELADLYFERAHLTGDRKQFEASEAMARRSLDILRSPNSAVLTLAKLANARHAFRESIDLAREALAQQVSPGALTVLASSHLALGEIAQACEAADAAVAQRPDSSTYLMRALVLQAQGRDAEAAFDFSRAALAEEHGNREESARIRALWGRFLLRRGELAGARLLFDEALRIVPGLPLALALQGELALREGRADDARGLFEEAFAASRQVRYLIDEARARELSGDRAAADVVRGQVEKIVRAELAEGGFGHRLDLVEVLVDRGRDEDVAEAVALAREEVAMRPSADARFQLARALARSGAGNQALIQVRAALATGTRDAQLYELAARLENQAGSEARAAVYSRLAAKLDPGGSNRRSSGPPNE